MRDLTVSDLEWAAARLAEAVPALEQSLNTADAALGDGDTGTMLARVIHAIAGAALDPGDFGASLIIWGRTAASATGSSLGTLIAAALLTSGRVSRGRAAIPPADLAPMIAAARDVMLQRGQTELGDKTVIDALDAAVRALEGAADRRRLAETTADAARTALDAFRDRPCRKGRARMFAERSAGLDDPGMLAFAAIAAILAGRELPAAAALPRQAARTTSSAPSRLQ